MVIRELWERRKWLVPGVLLSALCATLVVCQVQLLPPKLTPRELQYSSGSIQAWVDAPSSLVGDMSPPIGPLNDRATFFGNILTTPGALIRIGSLAHIPGNQIWGAGPIDPSQIRELVEPTATKRSYEVAGESRPYRIEFLTTPNQPILSVYTQAPTTTQALALANASVRVLGEYVLAAQLQQHVRPTARVRIRTIGQASAAVVNAGITRKLAGFTFLVVFVAWCVLLLIAARVRVTWRRTALAATTWSIDVHSGLFGRHPSPEPVWGNGPARSGPGTPRPVDRPTTPSLPRSPAR